MGFYIMLCDYIVVIASQMTSVACKLYACCSVVECFNCKWPLYSVTAGHAYENCLCQEEQKNAKLYNQTCFKGLLIIIEYQNFLEKGKLIVSGASVVCIVSHRCPIFMVYGILKKYCRRMLVILPDISMFSTFSLICIYSKLGSKQPSSTQLLTIYSKILA